MAEVRQRDEVVMAEALPNDVVVMAEALPNDVVMADELPNDVVMADELPKDGAMAEALPNDVVMADELPKDGAVIAEALPNDEVEFYWGRESPFTLADMKVVDQVVEKSADTPRGHLDTTLMDRLPDQILLEILKFVGRDEIRKTARYVCKRWMAVGRDRSIWKGYSFNEIDNKFLASVRYGLGIKKLLVPVTDNTNLYKRATSWYLAKALAYLPELKHVSTPILMGEGIVEVLTSIATHCADLQELDITVKRDIDVLSLATTLSLFANRPKLRTLRLHFPGSQEGRVWETNVIEKLADSVVDYFPDLQELSFRTRPEISGHALATLATLELVVMDLVLPFSVPLPYLAHFCLMTNLQALQLGFYHEEENLTLEDLKNEARFPITRMFNVISNNVRDLVEFDVTGYYISDVAISYIARRLTKLEVLHLKFMEVESDLSVEHIARHCTKLEELWLIACKIIRDEAQFLDMPVKNPPIRGICMLGTTSSTIITKLNKFLPDMIVGNM